MASLKLSPFSYSCLNYNISNAHQTSPKNLRTQLNHTANIRSRRINPKATLEELAQLEAIKEEKIEESVKVLKNAAKTRKVAKDEVLAALSVIKTAKLDPSTFLNTLGGNQSPGRTWMLIFTAKDRLKRGSYFPITAVQRFDATASRIENGVYLGPVGWLTFEGRFSWKKKILAFIFESIKIKVGAFGPFQVSLPGQTNEKREPNTKDDPFFIWYYIDDELAVAQGKGGGTAFWCSCCRLT